MSGEERLVTVRNYGMNHEGHPMAVYVQRGRKVDKPRGDTPLLILSPWQRRRLFQSYQIPCLAIIRPLRKCHLRYQSKGRENSRIRLYNSNVGNGAVPVEKRPDFIHTHS